MNNSDVVAGANFSYENGTIRFFTQKGYLSGGQWSINNVFGVESAWVDVDPCTPLSDIIQCIKQDELADKANEINAVHLSPSTACNLFLSGAINIDILRSADETEDTVTFSMEIDGVERNIVVLKEPKYECVTVDKDRKPV